MLRTFVRQPMFRKFVRQSTDVFDPRSRFQILEELRVSQQLLEREKIKNIELAQQNMLLAQSGASFFDKGWEPRPPCASWEEKLKFFSSRDDVIGVFKKYVDGVKSTPESSERNEVLSQGHHDKGFAICTGSTIGMMGMGKTVCLILQMSVMVMVSCCCCCC